MRRSWMTHVEPDDEDVVKQQHDCCSFEGDAWHPREKQCSDIANIMCFRVLHAELPEDVRGVPGDYPHPSGDEDSSNPSQDGP